MSYIRPPRGEPATPLSRKVKEVEKMRRICLWCQQQQLMQRGTRVNPIDINVVNFPLSLSMPQSILPRHLVQPRPPPYVFISCVRV